MIFLLLLLSGIAMLGCGVWLMLSINDAGTLLDCFFCDSVQLHQFGVRNVINYR